MRKKNSPNVPVKYYVLHMYARKNVEVRTGLFEWVDQMVRHIGANPSLSVYPPARKARQSARPRSTRQRDPCTNLGHL
jgi:hypothetical protein